MRRVFALLPVFVAAWVFSQQGSFAQQPDKPATSGSLSVQATTISALRVWDTFVNESVRSGGLRLRSVVRDAMLPSRTVERFDQFRNDVRIWGADLVRDSEGGVPLSIFGELSPALQLSTDPALSEHKARTAILRLGGPKALLLTEPELMIVRLDSGDYRLAYGAVMSGGGNAVRIFVDGHTGAELMRYSEIHTQAAIGTGRGVLGDAKKVSVVQEAGAFFADDQLRPPVLRTYDMRGNLARAILVFDGAPLFASDRATDADNQWNDIVAVDAHAHIGWTYDFFFKRFGRRGLDNRDRPIVALINGVFRQDAISLPPDDLNFAVNAFWCNTCGPGGVGVMYFGNGIPALYTLDGQSYSPLAGALDVIAHELTHGVTSATSGLIYQNESGALNEAFSDMMGKSVEFFYHPPGSGVGQADYVLGKDVIRGDLTGARNGFRSMANPALYGDPDHYSRRYTGREDDGGVHINSGIANQAFYLAIEGGTNRTSGSTVQGVGPANREQIERVFYRAFTSLMPSNATFSTARATTVRAAQDLYGAGGSVERAVTQAWAAVGVF